MTNWHWKCNFCFFIRDSGCSKPNLFTSQEPKEMHKEKRTTQSDSKDQSCNLKRDIKVILIKEFCRILNYTIYD